MAEPDMRRQLLDDSVHFSCKNCTFCCDQPWRTMIETEKARALSSHDFGAYPQLAGKQFFHEPAHGPEGVSELAKGEGTRCLFLDTDGLCIIHKELGPEAKPGMCRQFPYLTALTWVEDRVSANFGCPAVQQETGPRLTDQAEEVAAVVPTSRRPVRRDARVPFSARQRLTHAEYEALLERITGLFDPANTEDVWQSFARALAVLSAVSADDDVTRSVNGAGTDSAGQPRAAQLPGNASTSPEVRAYANPSAAPMAARLLFAATLYPDTVPGNAGSGMGFFRRLTLIPKLLSLAKLSGGYASRLLGRNVSIDDVFRHPVAEDLDPAATRLLLRAFRARLWQRFLTGTRLPVIAGVHQHLQDFNAIIFLARAEAHATGATQLTEPLIRQALTRVEFHLANQPRLYDQTLKNWMRSQLCDLGVAVHSLRLMALKPPQPVPTNTALEQAEG